MNGWEAVSTTKPCDICGKPDNCKRSSDGSAIWCGRVSEGSVRQNNGGQFLHFLDNARATSDWLRSNPRPATLVNATPPKELPTRDWGRIARAAFDSPNADLQRAILAKSLGVSVESLERLQVGWLGRVRGWTVPERNAAGDVIGVNRRLTNGDKRRERNCSAGLTYDPENWLESPAGIPGLYLTEGMSSTASMLTMEFAAVGRPSNLGGVALLGELLKAVPSDWQIAVIGERDWRPHESLKPAARARHKPECVKCSICWPGWFGAVTTAQQLAVLLNRDVSWSLSPEGFKDVREWLNKTNEAKHGS